MKVREMIELLQLRDGEAELYVGCQGCRCD
ncbi:hypothetical protein M2277_005060 [Paenibacillus sp. LBL]|nr:hypothetical protein [Paenibacillus sp. LBL]